MLKIPSKPLSNLFDSFRSPFPFSTTMSQLKKEPPSKKRLSNLYSPYFLRLIQIVYGTDDILSQGGVESVEVMFSGIDLSKKKLLEVGSGFGGVATYLASQHDVKIIGVDSEPYMVMQANRMLENKRGLKKDQVTFRTLSEPFSLREFPTHSFDLVYHKEMLYHVPVAKKQEYIDEMFRVLKPGGNLVIADWVQGTPILGKYLKRAIKVDGFVQVVTVEEYLSILQKANFQDITFKNVTSDHIEYSKHDISRMKNSEALIRQELGNDAYTSNFLSWNQWLEAQEQDELAAGVFIGSKN